MEFGGVACISCAKRLEIHSPQPVQVIVCYSLNDANAIPLCVICIFRADSSSTFRRSWVFYSTLRIMISVVFPSAFLEILVMTIYEFLCILLGYDRFIPKPC